MEMKDQSYISSFGQDGQAQTNWIQTQLRIAPKRFVLVTVSAFAVGTTIGTTLAIALDLPPVLRVCQAMRSIKK